jgi:spore coat protein JB
MSHVLPAHYYAQLYDLQAVDFVLLELTLYLDTHPHDLTAIQQYNQFAQKRKSMMQPFEEEFGPLYSNGLSYARQPWDWIQPPWPWQV